MSLYDYWRAIRPRYQKTLAAILYDVWWHFEPERYPKPLREKRDKNLKEWLRKADILFSISTATKDFIAKISPNYSHKIKAIPLGSDFSFSNYRNSKYEFPENFNKEPLFFYPASHSGYQKNIPM